MEYKKAHILRGFQWYVYIYIDISSYILWFFNIALENGPFIDDKHDDFPYKQLVILQFAFRK
jgi:hypothetical protein